MKEKNFSDKVPPLNLPPLARAARGVLPLVTPLDTSKNCSLELTTLLKLQNLWIFASAILSNIIVHNFVLSYVLKVK